VWSLSVTWRRWRSHHSIRHSLKFHAIRKLHNSVFNRTWVRSYCRWKFYIAAIGIFDLFASVTLTLTRWPSYTNLIRIPRRYTGCANMNFLRQGLRKLSSDRQTDRHDRKIYHDAASWMVSNSILGRFQILMLVFLNYEIND